MRMIHKPSRAKLCLFAAAAGVSLVMAATAWGCTAVNNTHTFITSPSNSSALYNNLNTTISAYTTHDANTNGLPSANYNLKLAPYGWTQSCDHSDFQSSSTSSPTNGDIGSSGSPVTHSVTWTIAADPGTGSVCFSDEDAAGPDHASAPVSFTLV